MPLNQSYYIARSIDLPALWVIDTKLDTKRAAMVWPGSTGDESTTKQTDICNGRYRPALSRVRWIAACLCVEPVLQGVSTVLCMYVVQGYFGM
jgi:hypothetical protein